MDEIILQNYYRGRIPTKKVVEKLGITHDVFYKQLKEMGLHTKTYYYRQIQTGDEVLDQTLKSKYYSIIERSKGTTDYDTYNSYVKSDDYLTIIEYVEFVYENIDRLKEMWKEYIDNDRELKYAISVDRIDNMKPYHKGNIEFVTSGFNSWRRNVRPIKVTLDKETNYFLSAQEASSYYDLRRSSIGEILNGRRLYYDKYKVEHSTIEEVLNKNGVKNLHEYYNEIFNKE